MNGDEKVEMTPTRSTLLGYGKGEWNKREKETIGSTYLRQKNRARRHRESISRRTEEPNG